MGDPKVIVRRAVSPLGLHWRWHAWIDPINLTRSHRSGWARTRRGGCWKSWCAARAIRREAGRG